MVYSKSSSGYDFESVPFNGGRIEKTSSGYEINYHIKDQVGSVRAVVNQNNEIKQQNDYYAFGLKHENAGLSASDNRYQFSSKESQSEFGVNYYDFHARQYDPNGAIFTSQDPLQDEYTSIGSYSYCAGNPVRFIDPDGRKLIDANRNVLYKDGQWTKAANFTCNRLLVGYLTEMNQYATGSEQFERIVNSEDIFRINMRGEYGRDSGRLGSMSEQGLTSGNTFFEIFIYQNSHHRAANKDGVDYGTAVMGTIVHELQHTTSENRAMTKQWLTNDSEDKISWEDRAHEVDAEKSRHNFIDDVKTNNFVPLPEEQTFLNKISEWWGN